MGRAIDMERVRIERLVADLLPAIRAGFAGPGVVRVPIAEVEDVDRWRRAARACARELGVTCRTSISDDGTFVSVVDTSPVTFPERVHTERRVAEVMASLLRP